MTRCQFCPRKAEVSLYGVYDLCPFCDVAFKEGFDTGRVYESDRRKINPRRLKKKK